MEENIWCVYQHTCPNGKVYIGITSQKPERRWRNGHGYKGQNNYFWRAICKYGWENIKHEILEDNLTNKEACEKEKQYIQEHQSTNRKFGYNITDGGEGCTGLKGEKNPMYGIPRTDEAKKNISKAIQKYYETHEKKPVSEETRKKLSIINSGENNAMYGRCGELNPFYGKTHSEETRRILSEKLKGIESAFKGHKHTEKTKQILREKALERCNDPNWISPITGKHYVHKGFEHTEETKKLISILHSKEVWALDDNMNIVTKYPSVTKATDDLGLNSRSAITNCIKAGIEYTSGGYHWCYPEDYERVIAEYQNTKSRIRRVCKYDMEGNYIKTYNSVAEAELECGIFATSISACCRGRQNCSGGFLWKYEDDNTDIREKVLACKNVKNKRRIVQYSTDMKFIKEYDSITIASKETGVPVNSIHGCCKGRYKTGGGYIWKYLDEV